MKHNGVTEFPHASKCIIWLVQCICYHVGEVMFSVYSLLFVINLLIHYQIYVANFIAP